MRLDAAYIAGPKRHLICGFCFGLAQGDGEHSDAPKTEDDASLLPRDSRVQDVLDHAVGKRHNRQETEGDPECNFDDLHHDFFPNV